ncbi:hypothetical protein RRG08_017886 [Elysia crispata]|uniref:Uncharacterized protein n=1 Tax=Elysia crispata TaxID=231223 RepID=A0AAE0XPR5_9GAST|nr:hypothetical protein RRG08_017886 [Elysia crispata]
MLRCVGQTKTVKSPSDIKSNKIALTGGQCWSEAENRVGKMATRIVFGLAFLIYSVNSASTTSASTLAAQGGIAKQPVQSSKVTTASPTTRKPSVQTVQPTNNNAGGASTPSTAGSVTKNPSGSSSSATQTTDSWLALGLNNNNLRADFSKCASSCNTKVQAVITAQNKTERCSQWDFALECLEDNGCSSQFSDEIDKINSYCGCVTIYAVSLLVLIMAALAMSLN